VDIVEIRVVYKVGKLPIHKGMDINNQKFYYTALAVKKLQPQPAWPIVTASSSHHYQMGHWWYLVVVAIIAW